MPRNILMFFFMLTMYFSGGLIPTYLVVNNLHLTNTFWAMIIPGAISIYNVIITRTYFINSIPKSLEEAAELDGANTFQLLIKVVLPLSKPILAVIGLYYAVGHWNDFYTGLIYINDKSLLPLQSFLRDLLMSNKMSMANMQGLDAAAMEAKMQLAQTLKYSVIIVSTVPVLCIYPFIQKYFVKGVMIGSVKRLNQRDGVFGFFTVPFGFLLLCYQRSILSHFSPSPMAFSFPFRRTRAFVFSGTSTSRWVLSYFTEILPFFVMIEPSAASMISMHSGAITISS